MDKSLEVSFNLARTFAVQIMKKAMFLCFVKVHIDYLFDNLQSGKRNCCFGKKVWKISWILDPIICVNPV